MNTQQAKKAQMHGKDWDGRDVSGWWASEKLDGCRAYWDGANLHTKEGNPINLPRIAQQLPAGFALDGELWAGRNNLQTARIATQYGKDDPRVKFVAFDAPGVAAAWPERLAAAARAGAQVVACWEVLDMATLFEALANLLQNDAEGIMVRLPALPYKPGRSGAIMKIKAHSVPMFMHHAEAMDEPEYY